MVSPQILPQSFSPCPHLRIFYPKEYDSSGFGPVILSNTRECDLKKKKKKKKKTRLKIVFCICTLQKGKGRHGRNIRTQFYMHHAWDIWTALCVSKSKWRLLLTLTRRPIVSSSLTNSLNNYGLVGCCMDSWGWWKMRRHFKAFLSRNLTVHDEDQIDRRTITQHRLTA